jgi:hypothetical protein
MNPMNDKNIPIGFSMLSISNNATLRDVGNIGRLGSDPFTATAERPSVLR